MSDLLGITDESTSAVCYARVSGHEREDHLEWHRVALEVCCARSHKSKKLIEAVAEEPSVQEAREQMRLDSL